MISVIPEEWLSSKSAQTCVRLTVIDVKIKELQKEHDDLTKELKRIDELTYYKYIALSESDKNHFIELNNAAICDLMKKE